MNRKIQRAATVIAIQRKHCYRCTTCNKWYSHHQADELCLWGCSYDTD